MLNKIYRYKKAILYLSLIILIPIIIPILDTLIHIIVTFGRYIGTTIRNFIDGVCCMR